MLKVAVEQISEAGKEIKISKSMDWVNEVVESVTGGTDASCEGQLLVHRFKRRLEVSCVLTASSMCGCERCGEPFTLHLESDHKLSYIPGVGDARDTEQELGEGDLDVGWYDNDALNILDVISEALALSLPERVICLDVEGCERRTTALLASARADVTTGHPGFASLKDF